MNRISICLLLFMIVGSHFSVFGQNQDVKPPKGHLYFSFGYNKDWYSKSDIHFESKNVDDYNFTIYDVKAIDNPSFNKIFVSDISVPQFIYRVGYMFAKHSNMGIEIAFDHAKYIMKREQLVHLKGNIHENYFDKDTFVTGNFIRFEHTNGANFLMANFIYRKSIFQNKSGKSEIFSIIKPGLGIVIPQSEVALFGVDQNNNYHIAGYVMGVDLQMHYEYKKHFLFETGFKGVFANYVDVLSVADSKANHHFFCLEWLIAIGYQLPI